ncbi:MAG: RecX family transcriptional regulator [Candidatus Omnitrophica bacterium]|nr:RecX family transcriptional regulator [Candidatus Omnitrophota bacterium]
MKDFNQALSYSFLLLKYRARSKTELVRRLKEKKYSGSVVKQTVQYLEKNNYIDDKEFARLFILSAIEKGWGPRKVDFRLKQLGVSYDLRKPTPTLNTAFNNKLSQIVEERVTCLKKQKPPLSSKKISQKVMRLVLSRGFNYSEVSRIIDGLGVTNFENC